MTAKLYYEVNEEAVHFGQSIATDDELREADSILYSQSNFGTQELRREFDAYQEIGIPGELGKIQSCLSSNTPNQARLRIA